MKPKEKRNRQSELLKANEALDDLTKKLEFAAKQNGELVMLICALVQEHHRGKANLSPTSIQMARGFAVNVQNYPALGFFQVRAVSPAEQRLSQHPVGEAPKEITRPESPLNCANDWHVRADAMGARCPECGSRMKLENCQAVVA